MIAASYDGAVVKVTLACKRDGTAQMGSQRCAWAGALLPSPALMRCSSQRIAPTLAAVHLQVIRSSNHSIGINRERSGRVYAVNTLGSLVHPLSNHREGQERAGRASLWRW